MKTISKSIFLVLLLIFFLLIICNLAVASTFSFIDQTKDDIYAGFSNPDNNNKYGLPIYEDSSQYFYTLNGTPLDHIGNNYDTQQVDITLDNSGMTIDILTRFNGLSSLVTENDNEIADFFLDFDLDGVFETGIDLSYDIANSQIFSNGIFSINSWTTSWDIFHNKISSNNTAAYYGGWLDPNSVDIASQGDIGVDFDQSPSNATNLGNVSVSQNSNFSIYSYSITIAQDILQDAGYTPSGGFGFFFATAECGNDVIRGKVPEPTTMLLFGIGLLGLGAIGRKRRI